MDSWEELLISGILRRVREAFGEVSFTRLVWFTENFEKTVLPFLRGDFDALLKDRIPPMPLREIDAAQYLLERDLRKPPDAP